MVELIDRANMVERMKIALQINPADCAVLTIDCQRGFDLASSKRLVKNSRSILRFLTKSSITSGNCSGLISRVPSFRSRIRL